jgi:hypothetical protein
LQQANHSTWQNFQIFRVAERGLQIWNFSFCRFGFLEILIFNFGSSAIALASLIHTLPKKIFASHGDPLFAMTARECA